ncbi:MAG TPA: hypothetical protein VMZ69_01425 [Saprospiraceae bacterium]|nr:hypothetical protein [Saprospiraceae bacterium]
MLEFFKRNHLFNSLLLLPYAFVIRSVVIVLPAARIPGEIFGTWAGNFLRQTHQWGIGEFLLSTFIIFIQAVIINRLFIRQSMLGEINLFPGLAYVLLTAFHPAFIGMSSVLLANTTVLFALMYLFDILKKEKQEETRYMAGWWLAVSGLLYTPYLILVLFGLIGMSILKTLKIKDIFQYITGYVSPFLIGWLIRIIITEDLDPGVVHVFDTFGIPTFGPLFGIPDVITTSFIALLFLFSLLGYTQVISRKNIHAQKKIDTLYAFVFFCFPMALFPISISVHYLFVFLIPFSLFLAILLRLVKHPAVAESIHFILFVTAILTQVLRLV